MAVRASMFDGMDVGFVREQVMLGSFSTWKIGGPADVLVEPGNDQQLQTLLTVLYDLKINWTVLGRGSNVLISDEGVRGVVIRLASEYEKIAFQGDKVVAGAGYSLIKLASIAAKEGLSGLEFAGGIPATVGGAVYMNAGAHGGDFSDIFDFADGFLVDGRSVRWSKEDLTFSYRHTSLHQTQAIVTRVGLQLRHGDRKQIGAAMAGHKFRRLQTQPLMLPCCGSVFRNPLIDPERMYAAQLIERAGLKGFQIGGAQISLLHANFIINTGTASAADVLKLILHIQKTVRDAYDVQLEPEVRMLGVFPMV